MAAWSHYIKWDDGQYEQYRSYVAKNAPLLSGTQLNSDQTPLDCADLSIGLLIDFAASKGLPVNFWDVDGFVYASMAEHPFGPNGASRPAEKFMNRERFKFIVRKYIQVKSLYKKNTSPAEVGTGKGTDRGDLMIRYKEGPSGAVNLHHAALVFAVYPPGMPHPKQDLDIPSFPGPDEAMDQTRVTEYFMGTVDDKFMTKYRVPDLDIHFDYLNSRGEAKRNAELIYFANYAQLCLQGFDFLTYAPPVLWDWRELDGQPWDGKGRPPMLDTRDGFKLW